MKKGLKKVLAVVLCLTFIMSASVVAFAAKPADVKNDWGYDFQGVYRVKEGQIISVDIPSKALSADEYDVYIENEDVAIVAENETAGKISVVGIGCGATVLTFYAMNGLHKDGDWEYYDEYEQINYLVVVYDNYDVENTTGKVTNVYAYDTTFYVGEEGFLDYDVETDGDAQWYSVVYIDYNECGYLDDSGYFEASDRGTCEGIIYAVDINGNYAFDDFSISTRYTPWQWLLHFVRVIAEFLFGWIRY